MSFNPNIIVFGVGGAGCNAVNNMVEKKLLGVQFVAANTDVQSLMHSKADVKIQLGSTLTQGLGAGGNPEVGREAARENTAEIKETLKNCNMLFITAGMGGGTGTGAAPLVAKIAKEMNILTIGVITKPFGFEGRKKMDVALDGIRAMKDQVGTLIIVPNQNLMSLANEKTTNREAFILADEVLYNGVAGISDIIVRPGHINLDLADLRSVMAEMGRAVLGTGEASGKDRATLAAQRAIQNPLLENTDIAGARQLLINISGGDDLTLFETEKSIGIIAKAAGENCNIHIGSASDENLKGKIRVSLVATGIKQDGATSKLSSVFQSSTADKTDEHLASIKNTPLNPFNPLRPLEEESDTKMDGEGDNTHSSFMQRDEFSSDADDTTVHRSSYNDLTARADGNMQDDDTYTDTTDNKNTNHAASMASDEGDSRKGFSSFSRTMGMNNEKTGGGGRPIFDNPFAQGANNVAAGGEAASLDDIEEAGTVHRSFATKSPTDTHDPVKEAMADFDDFSKNIIGDEARDARRLATSQHDDGRGDSGDDGDINQHYAAWQLARQKREEEDAAALDGNSIYQERNLAEKKKPGLMKRFFGGFFGSAEDEDEDVMQDGRGNSRENIRQDVANQRWARYPEVVDLRGETTDEGAPPMKRSTKVDKAKKASARKNAEAVDDGEASLSDLFSVRRND